MSKTISSSSPEANALLKAFGINIEQVKKAVITFEVDQPVMVEIEKHFQWEEGMEENLKGSTINLKFQLVEDIPEEEGSIRNSQDDVGKLEIKAGNLKHLNIPNCPKCGFIIKAGYGHFCYNTKPVEEIISK